MDMDEHGTARVIKWQDVPREQLTPTLSRKAVHGERVTLAQFFLGAGTLIPMHQHENEQCSSVIEGELEFRIGSEDADPIIVRSGEVMMLPPNTPHGVRAVVDTFVLDVFGPRREDWIAGGDQYLRQK
jgi:quercetin dioxygenase-like cupin family protein